MEQWLPDGHDSQVIPEEKTGINTVTAEEPIAAVAIGTGIYAEMTARNNRLEG